MLQKMYILVRNIPENDIPENDVLQKMYLFEIFLRMVLDLLVIEFVLLAQMGVTNDLGNRKPRKENSRR